MKFAVALLLSLSIVGCDKKTSASKDDDDDAPKKTKSSATEKSSASPSSAPTGTAAASTTASATSAAPADPLASFVEYKSDKGKYAMKFPSAPTVNTSVVPTMAGDANQEIALVEQGKSAFMASHADYPKGTKFDRKKALDGARDGMVQATNGTNVTSKDFKIEGQDGYEVTFDVAGAGKVRSRYFFIESRLYTIATVGVEQATSDAFLASFKLVK